MKIYFERFAWKNSDLTDFFKVIEEVISKDEKLAGLNLKKWEVDWIERPSLNEIKVIS